MRDLTKVASLTIISPFWGGSRTGGVNERDILSLIQKTNPKKNSALSVFPSHASFILSIAPHQRVK